MTRSADILFVTPILQSQNQSECICAHISERQLYRDFVSSVLTFMALSVKRRSSRSILPCCIWGFFARKNGDAIMDSEMVPSALADIAPVLRLANEIESGSPRVAYLCRLYAYERAQMIDPTSSGRGVRQYKAALLQRLMRWNDFFKQDETSRRQEISNAAEIQEFYGRYYRYYIRGLENADSTRLTKAYQTALILFEVLKAVTLTVGVDVTEEILEAHTNVVERAKTRDPESLNQAPLNHPEIVSQMKHPNDLKIPLEVIKDGTQDFNERNLIGKGGYGRVYKGIISRAYNVNLVAIKRLDATGFQGNKEFQTELTTLSQYKHDNIIKLIGFCDDNKEMILVYEYATHGSLDKYLRNPALLAGLSWIQLLNICIDVASALDYLHNHAAEKHRIIHRDIKSANILLDENWKAKLADFGLARIGLANQRNTFVITNLAGTHGYCDPQYERTGILTKESDVYSFGVVLFEVLCGRLACDIKYSDERRFLHHLARTCYKNGELDTIIDDRIKKDIKLRTLLMFSNIAYRCLQETREKRPTITEVLFQLTKAMEIQLEDETLQDEVIDTFFKD